MCGMHRIITSLGENRSFSISTRRIRVVCASSPTLCPSSLLLAASNSSVIMVDFPLFVGPKRVIVGAEAFNQIFHTEFLSYKYFGKIFSSNIFYIKKCSPEQTTPLYLQIKDKPVQEDYVYVDTLCFRSSHVLNHIYYSKI